MAKKVVVPDESPKVKKKRSKCCTCCLAVLIVCLLLIAVVACAGWVLGDKYAKQYLNMSMKDTMGVLTGLYGANDKKVVKYGFDAEKDLDGFYDELKANLFLKTDKDIDFDSALNSALDTFFGAGAEQQSATAARKNSDGDVGGDGQPDASDGSQIMDVVVDMIADVFNRDNIDVERLSAYDESNDTYIFNLKDKQLAAFVSWVLNSVLENADKLDAAAQITDMIKLDEVVSLKQIKFNAVSETNELGENTVKATTADLTIWLGLQNAAGQALTKLTEENGFGWAGGMVRWLGNVLLPKNLYVTATVPLYGDEAAQVTINAMSEKKRDNAYKLVNGVLNLSGQSGTTVESMLGQAVDKITPVLQKVADKIDFASASEGYIKVDIIDALAVAASKSLSAADPLTKPDLMYMLQAVLASSPQNKLEELKPFLWDGWYADANGEMVFDPADKNGFVEIDYEKAFITAIEDAYSVKFADEATLDDVLDTLGISFDGGSAGKMDADKLMSLIDKDKFSQSLDKDRSELKLRVTDKMLAAVFNDQMGAMLGDGGFAELDATLAAITFIEKEDRPEHLYALLAVNIDLTAMFGNGDDVLSKLTANILPENIVFTVTVDITDLSGKPEFVRDAVEYQFNDSENTDRVMSALGKLAPELDLSSVSAQIESMLTTMLDSMKSQFDVELVATSDENGKHIDGALVMPDIFRIVTDKVLTDDNGAIVTPDELKSVVKGLERTDGVEIGTPAADDYSGFIGELTDKYYIKATGNEQNFDDIKSLIGDNFDGNKFRITGEDGDNLAHDTRDIAELKPIMTGAELGKIVKDELGESNKFKIESVTTVNNGLVIVLSLPIGQILPANVADMISAQTLYVTVEADTSTIIGTGEDSAYKLDLKINDMDETAFAATLKLAEKYAKDFDFTSQVNDFGKTLYKQLKSLDEQLGAPNGESFIEFTADGLKLASFYDFMKSKMDLAEADAETVKKAVQGMYPKNAAENPNNYVADGENGFIVNKSAATNFDESMLVGGVSDMNFNGYFQSIIDRDDSGFKGNGIKVVQTVILASGDINTDAANVRKWANDRMKKKGGPDILTVDGEYVLLTFEMEMSKFMTSTNSMSNGFMPTNIYATVALERYVNNDNGGNKEFRSIGLVFNDMYEDAYSVLIKLMGLTDDDSLTGDDTVNITSITKYCVNKINDESWVKFVELKSLGATADAGTTGIGKISSGTFPAA